MKTQSEYKIIIAGFGGQGIVLAGNLLARACIFEDKYVTGMVAYGAEMRGGTANATIIISDAEIASPVVETPDIGVFLNQPSLDRFENDLAPRSLVITNASLVDRKPARTDLRHICVEATSAAEALGNTRVANIVALGALLEVTKLVRIQSIAQAIDELFAEKSAALAQINKTALYKGAELVRSPR
jgi:2-oxoglutarate ferredoxin oxidoreductase subunit gamma